MKTMTVSQKGWVVLPAELREKYHLHPGAKVTFVEIEGGLQLVPIPDDPIAALVGFMKDTPELLNDLLEERRREVGRDEKQLQQWIEKERLQAELESV